MVASFAATALLAAPSVQVRSGAERSPSREELRALLFQVVANQHRNDEALLEYERIERHRSFRGSSEESAVKEDKTYRVFPTGTGTIRVLLRDGDRLVPPAQIQQHLEGVVRELERAQNPSSDVQRPKVERFEKRRRERHQTVDAAREAFLARWLGREQRNGRTLASILLEPNPDFRPPNRIAAAFQSVRAVVWIDEPTAQLVRAEAEIFKDISFGGGILGKLYRGGTFVIEQTEVAPGIWLPARYEFDYRGRRFLFGFSVHEQIDISDYRRLGPPAEALVTLRRELAAQRPAGVAQ
ncbi:MAG: hypothetical protein K6U02_01025 [Firmicutes bacterium]|nr:hypothetical protein [Bacillota bacterium]